MKRIDKGMIAEFCKKNNMSIQQLSEKSGVSLAHLHLINKDPHYNLTIDTMEKLYKNAGLELKYYSKRVIN